MILVSEDGTTAEVATPTPTQLKWTYLVTLTGGADGVVWDLNNGPVTLTAGARLFDMPPVEQWRKRSVGLAGSRRTGLQVDEQTLSLPLWFRGRTWDEYRDLEKAFWESVIPEAPSLVQVTSPDAIVKSINGWLTTPGDLIDDTDPLLLKRRLYEVGLVAPGAYWQGPTISRSVTLTPPIPFLDPPGPPIYLNPPNDSQNSTIDNPGDVPAWTQIVVSGPAAGFTISVGDAFYQSTTAIAANDHVLIDAESRSILDAAGNRIFDRLDRIVHKTVPRGKDIPLGVDVTGFTAATPPVTFDLVTQYRRPL